MAAANSKRADPGAPSVRLRLLDAAESLFADFGYRGVSVRQIAAAAKVNLGSLPYHFRTKEDLFREVLLRRAEPMRAERRRRLAELAESGRKPELEELMEALLEPAFRTNRENEAFRRILGRTSMDPTPEIKQIMLDIYNLEFMTVPGVLRQFFPDMDAKEFHWKLNCFYGVMLWVQADTGKIQSIAGDDFDTANDEETLQHVIPFLAAGFRAQMSRRLAGRPQASPPS
jgi:AcrR family transcriptional regulator